MKNILISGSSGLIGSHISTYLSQQGYSISRLARQRHTKTRSEIFWDPVAEILDDISLQGFDIVIHLAGATIASWPWNQSRKAKIKNSRVAGTSFLSNRLANLNSKPNLLICASAIGYYGNRGEEILDEDSPAGKGFLSEVCQEWEAAAEPAKKAGIRVVHLRFGMVLDAGQGALAKMLPIFKMGIGGIIGNGKQFVSWISLADVAGIMKHVIDQLELVGPINVVASTPVRQAEFSKALGRVLSRPVIFRLPSIIMKAALGQMAEELLLASTRVLPKKLLQSGYRFEYSQLEPALRDLLGG